MDQAVLPEKLDGVSLYFVGIKGTGMAALAELFLHRGAGISGSDTADHFYTDEILRELGIPFYEGFSPANVPPEARLVIYSAAYRPDTHPELLRARELGLPLMTYTEALGGLSGLFPSAGVAGVHGKTTTTAMAGTLVREAKLSGAVLVGSAAANFGGRSTYSGGTDFFIAETCEYRRHFLSFDPRWIVLTSVEADHLDYFKDYDDILSAFVEFGRKLHSRGTLIYCADDSGARDAARRIRAERTDIRLKPYGETAEGPYRVSDVAARPGATTFRLEGFEREFEVRVPGRHTVLNAAAAVALVREIRDDLYPDAGGAVEKPRRDRDFEDALVRGLSEFRGSKRRSEILGEARGVLFADDYAHHPTAIKTTLKGFKEFYPGRRIVVDFMSHTYSRTAALLTDFAESFEKADLVVLHKIYASARETYSGTVSGRDLFRETSARHPRVEYFDEPADAAPFLRGELAPGDLFITLGAGDNFRLGKALFAEFNGANQ
jgi:UDP-N-acetylmuramate--alanine ligase